MDGEPTLFLVQPPTDVLADDPRHRRGVPPHTPTPGELLELDGFVGTVVAVDRRRVSVEDRRRRRRHFALDGQLAWVDDRPVSLRPAAARPASATTRTTASGAVAGDGPRRARVARASRVWVEGLHDAVLLETVWGDELRDAGVVVEPLGGIDDLAGAVAAFSPGPTRRLGVLVDHLVAGSKEARIAASIDDPAVLVTGHPFVDVWAAVRPSVVGIDRWPEVPHGTPWKQGVCDLLGFDQPRTLWQHIAASVRTWRDLERPLVTAVEQLLDHVIGDPDGPQDA